MSNFRQFFDGMKPAKSIIRGVANVTMTNVPNMAQTNSGSLTANVSNAILSLTGSGVVKGLGVRTSNATSRTVTLKITVDGTVVYDENNVVAATDAGLLAIGSYSITDASVLCDGFLVYTSSFLVEVTTSITEVATLQLVSNYYTT